VPRPVPRARHARAQGQLGLRRTPAAESDRLEAIAFIRYRFMGGKLLKTIVQVIVGGSVVFAIGLYLGRIRAS
jgi:hypothetical protein